MSERFTQKWRKRYLLCLFDGVPEICAPSGDNYVNQATHVGYFYIPSSFIVNPDGIDDCFRDAALFVKACPLDTPLDGDSYEVN